MLKEKTCIGVFSVLMAVTVIGQANAADRDDFDRNDARLPVKTLNCGDTVTSSLALAADLNCPNTAGYALSISGNGIVLDGRGHQIISPKASAGVFVSGSSNTVKHLRINGIANGQGISAYNAPGLRVIRNDVSQNQMGILLYSSNTVMSDVVVAGNDASQCSLFGLESGQDGSGGLTNPRIFDNDFSQSGSYAIELKASSAKLDGDSFNRYEGSKNGIQLIGGSFEVHGLDLARDRITGTQLSAQGVASLTVRDSDLSSGVSSSSQLRIGMQLYQVKSLDVSNVKIDGGDYGISLTTDSGVATAGSIEHSSFSGNADDAIFIESFDSTAYGVLVIKDDSFKESSSNQDVLVESGTQLAPGSSL